MLLKMNKAGLATITHLSYSTQLSIEFMLLIDNKDTNIVGILFVGYVQH